MKILFYTYSMTGPGKRVKKILKQLIPKKNLELHRKTEQLSRRIKKSSYDLDIAVLLAGSKKELSDILSIRNQLLDLRIVLILPDREEKTITQGHTLYPRFLSYVDSDFKDLQAVVNKMAGLSNKAARQKEKPVQIQFLMET